MLYVCMNFEFDFFYRQSTCFKINTFFIYIAIFFKYLNSTVAGPNPASGVPRTGGAALLPGGAGGRTDGEAGGLGGEPADVTGVE